MYILDCSERHEFRLRLLIFFPFSILFKKKREKEKENELANFMIKFHAFQTGLNIIIRNNLFFYL